MERSLEAPVRSEPTQSSSLGGTSSNKSTSNGSRIKGGNSAAIFGDRSTGNTSTRMGLYGALSSCMAAVLLQPLDVIKTRQQQQSFLSARPSISAAAASIRRDHGFLGFWRGSLPTLFRVAPGTGIYFAALGPMMSTWEAVVPVLRCLPLERITDSPFDLDPASVPAWYLGFVSGVARGVAVAAFNPISIIKTRMESSVGSGSMIQGFSHLLRHEPPLNWFRGTLATICRDVPFSGLFFVVYVHLKGQLGVEANSRERVNFYALQNFACGAIAAATASAITHPFDVLRTRLQLDAVASAAATAASKSSGNMSKALVSPVRRGLVRGVIDLARTEGLGVLGRGLGMRLLKRSLMAALTWTSFEEIKTAASPSVAVIPGGVRNR